MEGFKRKNKRMNTKQPQNLDPTSSHHLEEILFGGIVDLDLLSYFPKNGQKSWEGSGGIKLSRFATMEREREKKMASGKMRKKAPFYRGHKMWPLGVRRGPADSPAGK